MKQTQLKEKGECMIQNQLPQFNNENYYSLDQCKNEIENFNDVMRIVISLAKEIRAIHEKNCLCLCVKPQTVYKEQSSGAVKLIIRYKYQKDKVQNDTTLLLPINGAWSAPELKHKRYGEICEATDIYSIGALIFWLVTNRVPTLSDVVFVNKLNTKEDDSICKHLDDNAESLLLGILARGLTNSVKSRYQSAEELLVDLSALMSILP